MNIKKSKYIETLDTLTDALGKSDKQSTDEVLADIKDEGIDADGALDRLKKARLSIASAAKRSALDSAREKRLKLIENGHDFIGKFSDWTRGQIQARIKELCGPEAGLAFRDLEAMGTEEMASILEDLEMAHRQALGEGDDNE
jgi:hypothetical protein